MISHLNPTQQLTAKTVSDLHARAPFFNNLKLKHWCLKIGGSAEYLKMPCSKPDLYRLNNTELLNRVGDLSWLNTVIIRPLARER